MLPNIYVTRSFYFLIRKNLLNDLLGSLSVKVKIKEISLIFRRVRSTYRIIYNQRIKKISTEVINEIFKPNIYVLQRVHSTRYKILIRKIYWMKLLESLSGYTGIYFQGTEYDVPDHIQSKDRRISTESPKCHQIFTFCLSTRSFYAI